MTSLTLDVLGTFAVARDGAPVTRFRGDKVRALLAYLATEADRAHRRAALTALLWPDQDGEGALRNLSQTLLRLRQALGDTAEPSPLLDITRAGVRWRGAGARVDVRDFARLAHSADPADLARAAALYRGEFLPGFALPDADTFEEWLQLTRAQLQQQALTALQGLATHQLTTGRWAEAATTARRAIALDPWREAPHRQLMQALAAGGDRAAALAQFQRCRAVLAEELGVEPSAETRLLHERILAGEVASPTVDPTRPRPGLPASLTPLVGREADLRALAALGQRADARLVTLVGAGGMGKTRLALDAARVAAGDYPDGATFVPLAPLGQAAALPSAIARALGVTLHGGDPAAALLHAVRDRRMLLVLDNAEHLLDGAGLAELVVALLEAAPDVRIIATSRQQLGVRGEHVYGVEGVEHAGARAVGGAGVSVSAAARLFLQSAGRARSGYGAEVDDVPVIERIGALVQGMPLALEMAAAWIGLLPLAEIAAEIARGLDFLQAEWADAPERQRSVRAVFDWSWRLLSEAEQDVLRRLSVFRGGFTREAAETVAGATLRTLARLSQASLVRWHPGNGTGRYEIHELLRQFAAERLEAAPGEREAMEARHGAYYLALSEEAAAEYDRPRQVAWLDWVEAEHDNIRVAQDRFADRGAVELELQLAGAMMYFWFIRGYHTEGAQRLLRALARPEAQAPTEVRVRALNAAGYLQWVRGNLPEARTLFTESVGIARALGAQAALAFGLCYLGTVLNGHGEYAAAEPLLEESLAIWEGLGKHSSMGLPLMFLGDAALGQHTWDRARAASARSADLFRRTGNLSVLPYPLRRLGYLALREHDDGEAMMFYLESMEVNREVGDRQGVAASLVGLAAVAEARRQPDQAARFLGAADALVESIQTKLLACDDEECERIAGVVRGELDGATFAAAWGHGRAMTFEQAVVAAKQWATGASRGAS